MNGLGNGKRQKPQRQPATTTSNSYSRPSYFGRDTAEGYKLLNQDRSTSRARPHPPNDRSRPKSLGKGASTTIQISSTEIVKMRKDLEQLGQQTGGGFGYYHSEAEFNKKAARPLANQTDRTPTSYGNQLANVSPIYTKKRHYDPDTDFNHKLEQLSRRLQEIKQSEYLSPTVETSYLERRNYMNTSLKQDRQSSRSVNSKRLQVSYNESVSFNLSKKPAKSIFLMSDVSHESSRAAGCFLEASGRTNQTSQRLGVPTSRETNKTGTSSIQYYLLQEKLQRGAENLQFEQLVTLKPHRGRITSMLQNPMSSQIYSTSLDYAVAAIQSDGQSHRELYRHRGGAECSLLVEDLLVTGGRDRYLRSNRDWSRRVDSVPAELLKVRDRILVRGASLYELDLASLQLQQKCSLEKRTSLLQSDNIPSGCLVGGKNTLSLYDSRKGRLQQLITVSDNITCWRMYKDRIVAVGKSLWVGSHNRMERVHTLPGEFEASSIVDYYSSYILCPREPSQGMLLYESDLNIVGRIECSKSQPSLFSIKNRLMLGHSDGRLDFCILR